MTTEEIINYQVLEISKANKEQFNKDLANGQYVVEGTFKNEHGELFVIFRFKSVMRTSDPLITGDEFGWEVGYQVDKYGFCYKEFMLDNKEADEATKIVRSIKK